MQSVRVGKSGCLSKGFPGATALLIIQSKRSRLDPWPCSPRFLAVPSVLQQELSVLLTLPQLVYTDFRSPSSDRLGSACARFRIVGVLRLPRQFRAPSRRSVIGLIQHPGTALEFAPNAFRRGLLATASSFFLRPSRIGGSVGQFGVLGKPSIPFIHILDPSHYRILPLRLGLLSQSSGFDRREIAQEMRFPGFYSSPQARRRRTDGTSYIQADDTPYLDAMVSFSRSSRCRAGVGCRV